MLVGLFLCLVVTFGEIQSKTSPVFVFLDENYQPESVGIRINLESFGLYPGRKIVKRSANTPRKLHQPVFMLYKQPPKSFQIDLKELDRPKRLENIELFNLNNADRDCLCGFPCVSNICTNDVIQRCDGANIEDDIDVTTKPNKPTTECPTLPPAVECPIVTCPTPVQSTAIQTTDRSVQSTTTKPEITTRAHHWVPKSTIVFRQTQKTFSTTEDNYYDYDYDGEEPLVESSGDGNKELVTTQKSATSEGIEFKEEDYYSEYIDASEETSKEVTEETEETSSAFTSKETSTLVEEITTENILKIEENEETTTTNLPSVNNKEEGRNLHKIEDLNESSGSGDVEIPLEDDEDFQGLDGSGLPEEDLNSLESHDKETQKAHEEEVKKIDQTTNKTSPPEKEEGNLEKIQPEEEVRKETDKDLGTDEKIPEKEKEESTSLPNPQPEEEVKKITDKIDTNIETKNPKEYESTTTTKSQPEDDIIVVKTDDDGTPEDDEDNDEHFSGSGSGSGDDEAILEEPKAQETKKKSLPVEEERKNEDVEFFQFDKNGKDVARNSGEVDEFLIIDRK